MTTESRKIQLETEVDATGARKGFEEVKQGARDMAQAVGQAGAQASKGMDGIGAGAQDGAQGIDRATRSIIGSIERATAALKAGGKAGSEYYELLARQRGVSVDTLRPYLDQLKQAEMAQQAASGSLGKMESSAKQTAAALRGVPAQFTDIITSLQGGQAPLTVFLQQGGQLKDMFGGAGNAARALSGYVLGLVNPMTVAAAVAGTLAVAYNQGSKEADGYRRAIVLTGNAAGTTTGQLTEYARAIAAVVGTQGKAAETIAAFVSTGRVQSQMLEQFSTAAIRFERATGQAVGETAKQFADLRNAPLEATLKLNEGMNYLTRSTYNQIKALEDQGRITEAAAAAQSAYADALNSRSGEMEANLGTIERGWLAVKDAAKKAWGAILNVGRAGTQADALAGLESNLARVQRELAGGGFSETAGGAVTGRPMDARRRAQLQAEEMALQEQVKLLRQSITLSQERAAAEAKAAEQNRARAAWEKEGLKYLDDRARLEREINAERERGLAAGASQAEIEARIAAIRERAAKKGPASRPGDEFAADRAAAKEWAQFYQRAADLADKAAGKVANLSEAQSELLKFLQSPAYDKASEAARQMTLEKLYEAAAHEQASAAQKESARIAEEATKAYGQWIDALEKSADAAAKQVQSLDVENRAAVIAAEGYYSLAQAVQLVEIARLEERQAAMLGNEDAVLAIQREIDKRRELVGLIGAKEARQAAADASKKAEQEALRSLQSIDDAGREAFLAIGREGVDAFERIGDSLKASVLDVLYQLTLRPYIIQVAAQVTGAPQSAVQKLTGGGGGSGALSAAGNLTSLLGSSWGGSLASGAFGGGITGLVGSGLSSLGSALGWSSLSGFGAGLTGAGTLAGSTALSMGASGAAAGAAVSAAIPWIGAAVALASLFGDRNKWTKGFGAATVLDGIAAAGQTSAFSDLTVAGQRNTFSNARYSDAIADGTQTVAQGIADMMRSFGGSGSFSFAQAVSTASKKNQAETNTSVVVNGQLFETGSTKSKKEDQVTVAAEQISRATLKVFQETVDGRFGVYFDSINALTADITDVQEVLQTASSVRAFGESVRWLGGSFDDLAQMGVQTTADLAAAAGGYDQLAQSAGAAYRLLYTEQERMAFLSEDVAEAFARLGQEVPTSAEGYKTALEQARAAMEAGTEGAAENYAALLQLVPAWDEVTNAAARAAAEVTRRLQDQTRGLEVGLLRASGDEAGADAMQRAIDIEGLTEAQVAIYDYNRALQAQIQALEEQQAAAEAAAEAAAQRAQAVADERAGLEQQLLQVQGDTAALRALEREALDASNRALYDQIKALEDQQAAAEAAAQAEAELASQRQNLEQRLLQMLGATAELRRRELAALDPSNRALQELIYGLEDLNKALDDAKSSARSQAQGRIDAIEAQKRAFEEQIDYFKGLLQRSADAELARIDAAERASVAALESQIATVERMAAANRESVATLQAILGSLSAATQALRGDSPAVQAQSYAQASSRLDQILANARLGGMPKQDELDSLLGVITSRGSEGYSTAFDFQRERLEQANRTEGLGKILGTQLTAQERMLAAQESSAESLRQQIALVQDDAKLQREAVEAQVKQAEATFSRLQGINTAVDSLSNVTAAIASLDDVYQADHLSMLDDQIKLQEEWLKSEEARLDRIWASAQSTATAAYATYNAVNGVRDAVNAVGSAISILTSAVLSQSNAASVPAFAVGGIHTGGLRLVGERGPELEVTGPARIYSASDTARILGAGAAQELVELRREQRAQTASMATLQLRFTKLLERWDRDGMPTTRTEVPA